MKAGIIYGSNSGGTHEVAELIRDILIRHGNEAEVINARDANPDMFGRYDVIVFGSCTWEHITATKRLEGAMQEHFRALATKMNGKKYQDTKFAVFALGDSSYTSFCSAANHLEILVRQVGGQKVGETLRIDKYFYNLEQNRKIIERWSKKLATLVPIHQKIIQ